MSERRLQPFECWKAAEGDPDKYRQLLIEHGHLVQREPPTDDELCAHCTKPFSVHVGNPHLDPSYVKQLAPDFVTDHVFQRLPESSCLRGQGQIILGRNTQRRTETGRQRDDG